MPIFKIRTRDSRHVASGGRQEYIDANAALAWGVRAAAMMVAEDIRSGTQASSIEILVHGPDDAVAARSVVTLAVAPILAG